MCVCACVSVARDRQDMQKIKLKEQRGEENTLSQRKRLVFLVDWNPVVRGESKSLSAQWCKVYRNNLIDRHYIMNTSQVLKFVDKSKYEL